MDIKKIFVYGTLQSGERLNLHLGNGKLIGIGKLKGYKMYTHGYFPMIKKGEGTIIGEVYEYEIEDYNKVIGGLDYIESSYNRTQVVVKLNDKEIKVETYVYKSDVSNFKLIPNGNWKSYS